MKLFLSKGSLIPILQGSYSAFLPRALISPPPSIIALSTPFLFKTRAALSTAYPIPIAPRSILTSPPPSSATFPTSDMSLYLPLDISNAPTVNSENSRARLMTLMQSMERTAFLLRFKRLTSPPCLKMVKMSSSRFISMKAALMAWLKDFFSNPRAVILEAEPMTSLDSSMNPRSLRKSDPF